MTSRQMGANTQTEDKNLPQPTIHSSIKKVKNSQSKIPHKLWPFLMHGADQTVLYNDSTLIRSLLVISLRDLQAKPGVENQTGCGRDKGFKR